LTLCLHVAASHHDAESMAMPLPVFASGAEEGATMEHDQIELD